MTTQQKNYIGFVNDHSGSMNSIQSAAIKDYNLTSAAVSAAASREMLDTIVYANQFGSRVTRTIVNSNPHVLKPISKWNCSGMTALYDAINDMIQQLEATPDASNPNVSFLVMATTDGDENSSSISSYQLAEKIRKLQATERWTFVVRVPRGATRALRDIGIPAGNIQEWETSVAGMEKSTAATTAAVDGYFTTRASGQKSSTVFYANAAAVDTSKLLDISGKVSLYVVESHENGNQIRDFILARRTRYLKGSAFYQLTKTEARVGPNKLIAIRDRKSGAIFAGVEAHKMLGLSSVDNIRLHPGDHGNYDLFIQSESVNRKLVASTGVLYWEEIGKPFTQEEIDRYTGVAPVVTKPAVVVLPQVAPTNKPTPSPLKPVAKVAAQVKPQPHAPGRDGRTRYHYATANSRFFDTREDARTYAALNSGRKAYDASPYATKGKRFFVDVA